MRLDGYATDRYDDDYVDLHDVSCHLIGTNTLRFMFPFPRKTDSSLSFSICCWIRLFLIQQIRTPLVLVLLLFS